MPLAETQKHAKHDGPEVRTEKAQTGRHWDRKKLGWGKAGTGKKPDATDC